MPKTLIDLIDEKFGVRTTYRINPLTSSVGTTPTRLLDNNPNRVAFILVNLSANMIVISPDEEVKTDTGISIAPNGGQIVLLWEEDFHLVGVEWFGIATALSKVYVLEIYTV